MTRLEKAAYWIRRHERIRRVAHFAIMAWHTIWIPPFAVVMLLLVGISFIGWGSQRAIDVTLGILFGD